MLRKKAVLGGPATRPSRCTYTLLAADECKPGRSSCSLCLREVVSQGDYAGSAGGEFRLDDSGCGRLSRKSTWVRNLAWTLRHGEPPKGAGLAIAPSGAVNVRGDDCTEVGRQTRRRTFVRRLRQPQAVNKGALILKSGPFESEMRALWFTRRCGCPVGVQVGEPADRSS